MNLKHRTRISRNGLLPRFPASDDGRELLFKAGEAVYAVLGVHGIGSVGGSLLSQAAPLGL